MNKYLACYNNKKEAIEANTSYEAQVKAEKYFNPPKSKRHMVTVMLVETENGIIIHSTSSIG